MAALPIDSPPALGKLPVNPFNPLPTAPLSCDIVEFNLSFDNTVAALGNDAATLSVAPATNFAKGFINAGLGTADVIEEIVPGDGKDPPPSNDDAAPKLLPTGAEGRELVILLTAADAADIGFAGNAILSK